MGKIKGGILGGFSGKVGSVVGASWKGIDYIRSLPSSVRNPRTPGQVKQRNKFSAVINFLSQITPLLRIGFKNYTGQQSAFNAAMSYNILNAVTGTGADITLNYPRVLISRGKLFGAPRGNATVVESEIILNWDSVVSGSASLNDQAFVLLYNSTMGEAKYFVDECIRSEGGYMFEFTPAWKGCEVECYVGFVSEDGKEVSNSLYLGQVEIPLD